MNSPSHTKGPWRIGGKAIDADGIYIRATHDEADYALALVIHHESLPNMANAELIAQAPELLAQRNALLAALAVATDSLCAIVNGEVVISNKGHKLYTFPDQSACLSEHDPKVIKARSAISQARNAIALAQGGDK